VELQKPNRSLAMNLSKSVAELQREHVVLELECIDRMYLNAYVIIQNELYNPQSR
jgi:hypothetical protein